MIGAMPMFVHIIAQSKSPKSLKKGLLIAYCSIAVICYIDMMRVLLDPEKTELAVTCFLVPLFLIWSLFGIWQTKVALKTVESDTIDEQDKNDV